MRQNAGSKHCCPVDWATYRGMGNWRSALVVLTLGSLAIALAVVGLGTGVESVPRRVELALFVVAGGMALATLLIALLALQVAPTMAGSFERWFVRLLVLVGLIMLALIAFVAVTDVAWLAAVPLAGTLPWALALRNASFMWNVWQEVEQPPRSWQRAFENGPPWTAGTAYLVTFALAASLGVAVVRPQTAPEVDAAQARASARLNVAIDHLRQSSDPDKHAFGDGLSSVMGALAGAGIALAPTVLNTATQRVEGLAKAGELGARGVLDVFGGLARGVRDGVSVHPEVHITPTVKIENPTFKIEGPTLMSLIVRPTWKWPPAQNDSCGLDDRGDSNEGSADQGMRG